MAADYGASHSDVQKRVPLVALTAQSKPSLNDVNLWIEEAESQLNNALKAGGITTPVTNAEGVEALKKLSIDYAEGLVRQSQVPAGQEQNEQPKLVSFEAVLADMRKDPQSWSAMLGGGSAESETVRLRSSSTHDVDGRAVTDEGLAPVFTKGDLECQF